jgi:cation transport ATPase
MIWIFIEIAIGNFSERLSLMIEGDIIQAILTNLRLPALISLLLVIPFMIMEVVNRRGFNEGFPIPLFVMMWLLPLSFILTVMPIVRNLRAGNSLITQPVSLLIRIVILVFVAWMWTSLLIDQMPCFLGVPNCDWKEIWSGVGWFDPGRNLLPAGNTL